MARTKQFIGIDVGSSMVRIAALERGDTGGLRLVGIGEAMCDGMRKGIVVSPDSVARSIQKAILQFKKNSGGLDVDHAFVSITEPKITSVITKGSVSISRADGEVTKEDIGRAVENAEAALTQTTNRVLLHSFPLSYNVDKEMHLFDPVGLIGAKLEAEVLFVTSFSSSFRALEKAVDFAGVEVEDIVAAPLATSYAVLNKKQKEIGTMVLDIGARTSSIAVFEEGKLISLEVLPIGSAHITDDIRIGFKIDEESAERVKKTFEDCLELGKKELHLADMPKAFVEAFTPKKLKEIVSARLDDVFEATEKHLKRINRAELLPGGVIITGGGSKLFEIEAVARYDLQLPAEVARSMQGISLRNDMVVGSEWSCAIGLAKFAVDEHTPVGFFSSSVFKRVGRWLKAFIP
ncbi:MAG: cell division protein FtsA [bacterium]|nr:cell division protein FtsA [bacterium]